jgi:hypothetical protein
MSIERDDFLLIWTFDAASALTLFGLMPQLYDVIELKPAPTTERELTKYHPNAKLFGVTTKRPSDHYTLALADGQYVRGAIQGSGGTIPAGQRARVVGQIERATAGKPLGIYEPEPGHCAMYKLDPEQKLEPGERTRAVDLRGAKLVHWTDDERIPTADESRVRRTVEAIDNASRKLSGEE